jgi:hypothetical protein
MSHSSFVGRRVSRQPFVRRVVEVIFSMMRWRYFQIIALEKQRRIFYLLFVAGVASGQ